MRGGREAADGARGDRAGRSAVWAEDPAAPGRCGWAPTAALRGPGCSPRCLSGGVDNGSASPTFRKSRC